MNLNRPKSLDINQVMIIPDDYTSESDLVLGGISASYVEKEVTSRMIAAVNVHTSSSISAAMSKTRHSVITPEQVMNNFNVGFGKAQAILATTMQKGVRMAMHPLHRRYHVDHLSLHTKYMKGQFYGDWLHLRTKSITQATGAFVFTNGGFTTVHPKDKHTHQRAGESLSTLIEDFGVPEMLKTDRAPEFCGEAKD